MHRCFSSVYCVSCTRKCATCTFREEKAGTPEALKAGCQANKKARQGIGTPLCDPDLVLHALSPPSPTPLRFMSARARALHSPRSHEVFPPPKVGLKSGVIVRRLHTCSLVRRHTVTNPSRSLLRRSSPPCAPPYTDLVHRGLTSVPGPLSRGKQAFHRRALQR